MELKLSLDLNDATLRDLQQFVATAENAGVQSGARLSLDGSVVHLHTHSVQESLPKSSTSHKGTDPTPTSEFRIPGVVGEQAIRSVIDILTGKQEPPR
ncbi:Uncharacterised protein [Corynebacterium renale]|uniref:hypothetical protein n=1 Tax=Corynebacterium renale TaxID=1724 RepID=UPI000DA3FF18|nr:hypothetical protein [Corynebacterium renale]SQG65061.1 Uncharacterised protein [Corynebacterium renale]STC97303.1 Uncharacterised protein [Corynebacterium renale]